jgi:hypothetical protein
VAGHPFETGVGQPITRTASIGFVAMPLMIDRPEAFNWEQLVSLADQCLYRAKNRGRDCWVGLLPDVRSGSRVVPPEPDWDVLVKGGFVAVAEGPAAAAPDAAASA